jgi:hypothetical protein
MATALEWQRLRDDTGHTSTTLGDVAAEAIFVEAAEIYNTGSVRAGTRVLAIQKLLSSSAKLHDYVQNNTKESASQVFAHLKSLLEIWENKVAAQDAASRGSSARFGRPSNKPARIKEHPGI